MAMLDGILYAVNNNKTEEDLLKELSKQYGEDADYLEKEKILTEVKMMYLKTSLKKKEIKCMEQRQLLYMKIFLH